MDAGPPPRSASYTGSTPRALGRARALENDIGEEEAARPTLEQLLRSAFDDDSPALVDARVVLERESRAPIGLSTLACWRPDVGACEELVAKRAHREAKPAAVDAEPPAPAPADAALVEPAQAPEPAVRQLSLVRGPTGGLGLGFYKVVTLAHGCFFRRARQ